ncbi:MAG: hypothetical protein ACTHOH_02625 [Lysobacteraceae bacterium]
MRLAEQVIDSIRTVYRVDKDKVIVLSNRELRRSRADDGGRKDD